MSEARTPAQVADELAENVRTLHKAVLAVARQDGADVLALTGITAVGGYQVAEGLALPSMELQLMPTYTTADCKEAINLAPAAEARIRHSGTVVSLFIEPSRSRQTA